MGWVEEVDDMNCDEELMPKLAGARPSDAGGDNVAHFTR
jgi:hypothetical protein